ncbi:SGT1-domain-containing protein [Sarocladium strictum]
MTEYAAPEAGGFNGAHQLILPENCVEYYLFLVGAQLETRKKLSQLESVRQSALKLSQDLTKDYIWQREDFNLELKTEGGLTYLYGITDYGDAVEDEWLIVYIIRELSRTHTSLWARIADADGEFLLVEAANVLPRWISPEIDRNRVWIHDGQLRIIPIDEESAPKTENLSLSHAINFIMTKSPSLVHSSFVEEEAFYRLGKYPAQIADSIHHSMVTIPRRLAFVIHSVPRAIAAAVEAFYLRDPISLKPILAASGSLVFPPVDMVTVSVRFSKVLFAQLRSQRFNTPPMWESAMKKNEGPGNEVALARLETGMKLTCGFEMLAASAQKSKSRIVRETAIVIEDLEEDGDDALPSDEEIRVWADSQRDDDERWMDINYEDFERELGGEKSTSGASKSTGGGFGDAQTQEDLRKIVSRFEAFLNDDKAGLDGAELNDMDYDNDSDDDDDDDLDDESDSEDREVGFDEAEFSKMMREMMGFRPEPTPAHNPAYSKQASAPRSADEAEEAQEIEEIRNLTSQMESELKEQGALRLDARTDMALEDKGKGKERASSSSDNEVAGYSDEEVDIDYNLAKNLLESFKSQGGMAGPTGNLLGLMGVQLPRDEEAVDDEKTAPNSSHSAKP